MDSFYTQAPVYENIRTKIRQYMPYQNQKYFSLLPIGKTVLGRGIFAARLGNPSQCTLFVGGVHGQEWLTTLLLFRFLDDLVFSITQNEPIADIDIKKALEHRGLVIVPALNPDGITIGVQGAAGAKNLADQVTRMCGGNFSSWQANARGIDINHNFDAGFEAVKQAERDAGITAPGPTKYGGDWPESEPETSAICQFIRSHPVRQLYAFHSQGEEIYYRYGEHTPPKSRLIAEILANASGYTVTDPVGTASHGGLKDWFINVFHQPGFTIEIGRGKNPLPVGELEPIYARLLEMLLIAMLL